MFLILIILDRTSSSFIIQFAENMIYAIYGILHKSVADDECMEDREEVLFLSLSKIIFLPQKYPEGENAPLFRS